MVRDNREIERRPLWVQLSMILFPSIIIFLATPSPLFYKPMEVVGAFTGIVIFVAVILEFCGFLKVKKKPLKSKLQI